MSAQPFTQPPATFLPPNVRFFSGRSESFFQHGSEWRRADVEDEAKWFSGYSRETHEPNAGIYIMPRPNGLVRIGWDLWKLNVNLCPAVIARIEGRWRKESAGLSKSMLRSVLRRSHFSKSFMRFEISTDHVEGWKAELESLLSDPASYEPLQRRFAEQINPESCQT
jgi:hypothetical protein